MAYMNLLPLGLVLSRTWLLLVSDHVTNPSRALLSHGLSVKMVQFLGIDRHIYKLPDLEPDQNTMFLSNRLHMLCASQGHASCHNGNIGVDLLKARSHDTRPCCGVEYHHKVPHAQTYKITVIGLLSVDRVGSLSS